MTCHRIWLCLLLSATVPASFAADVSVYKWTDAEGVTHYAQTPPGDRSADQIHLDVASTPQAQGTTDYRTILDQANDLERARLQREATRRQQLEAQRQIETQASSEAPPADIEQAPPQPLYLPVLVPRHHHGYRDRDNHGQRRSQLQRRDQDPAFAPPEQWLRSHPRLLRKELRRQRDSEPAVDEPQATRRH